LVGNGEGKDANSSLRLYNNIMTDQLSNSKIRSVFAYGVHLFTATGAVFGFLALLAVIQHEWRWMIVWMMASMLVDGLDGFLARMTDTKANAAKYDGALMDNIIDYFTYVVVPALFLYTSDVLPPGWGIICACAILLASAFQFSRTDAKTDDHFFKGFPSYWNIVAIYALILGLNPWVNLVIILFLVLLVFIPIKYIYPTRSAYLRTLTLVLIAVYAVISVWGLIKWYPTLPDWMIWATFLFFGYYFGLSLWLTYKTQKK
jgi:phosphatidylcholine synthase